MPSGDAEANEAAEPQLLLLQQRLQGLGLPQPGAEEEEEEEDDDGGETELREDEDEEAALLLPPLQPRGLDVGGGRGMMAAMLPQSYGDVGAVGGEQAALLRRKSVNTTECVAVPSSEHVAEIVGRQGCKIKALRAKTNTYIKTPARGEEPVFVVTGRTEDVAAAKREILSAAEHFSLIRAWRGGAAGPGGPCRPPAPPGHTTVRVRVPYRVVGLVVGPKGSTVKSIQRRTRTYIVTPGRGEEPAFQVTGAPEDVERARQEIEMHVAVRAGAFLELGHDGGADGTDDVWPGARTRSRMFSSYRNDSSGSLGSGSTDSYFSPTSPFGTGGFWIGEAPPAAGAEELAMDSPADEPLPAWAPFEPAAALSGSRPPTPRLSPTFSESLEHPLARWARSEPPGSGRRPELPVYIPAFSNGTSSYSSSNGGSASSSPPECRRRHDCVVCFDGEAAAALVPCGHNLFCLRCAGRICARDAPACPVCRTAVTQAIRSYS